MAMRSPEELDRMEERRQRHLERAKGQVKGVGLLLVLFVLLLAFLAGYGKGRAYVPPCAPVASVRPS